MSTATVERSEKAARIDADLAAIAEDARRKFVTAAIRTAKGESLPAAEIALVCQACNRPIEQFRTVVRRVRQRIDALAALDDVKNKHTECERLDLEQRNLAEEIKQLDEDYRAKRKPLAEAYVKTCGEFRAASSAANWQQQNALGTLRNTAARPDVEPNRLDNVKLE